MSQHDKLVPVRDLNFDEMFTELFFDAMRACKFGWVSTYDGEVPGPGVLDAELQETLANPERRYW